MGGPFVHGPSKRVNDTGSTTRWGPGAFQRFDSIIVLAGWHSRFFAAGLPSPAQPARYRILAYQDAEVRAAAVRPSNVGLHGDRSHGPRPSGIRAHRMRDVRSIVGSLMETAPAWGLVGRGPSFQGASAGWHSASINAPECLPFPCAGALPGTQVANPFLNCRPVRFEQSRGHRRKSTAQDPSLMRPSGGLRVRGLR